MELKITTLIENQPGQDGRLAFEHGLSLFIEFAGKRLLFDTGQTGAFADNAEKLSIDLSQLDAVILSHGHYDHSGGLARLLPLLSPDTPIYAGKEFFAAKYKKLPGDRFQYNGNPFPREIFASYPVRLHLLEAGVSALSPDILLFKNFDWSFPFEKPNPRFYTGDALSLIHIFSNLLHVSLPTRKKIPHSCRTAAVWRKAELFRKNPRPYGF